MVNDTVVNNYRRARKFITSALCADSASNNDIDTLAFLLKLVNTREAMYMNSTAEPAQSTAHQAVTRKLKVWTEEEEQRASDIVDEYNLADNGVRISGALLREVATRFDSDRTPTSLGAKLYEIRNKRREEAANKVSDVNTDNE